jgi:hypothetical protein
LSHRITGIRATGTEPPRIQPNRKHDAPRRASMSMWRSGKDAFRDPRRFIFAAPQL